MGIPPTGADRASIGRSSLDGSITGEAQRRTCHVRSEVVPGVSAGGGGGAGGAHPAGRYGAAYVACQHEEADDHESDDGPNDSPSAELDGHRMTIRRFGAGSTPAAALVAVRKHHRSLPHSLAHSRTRINVVRPSACASWQIPIKRPVASGLVLRHSRPAAADDDRIEQSIR